MRVSMAPIFIISLWDPEGPFDFRTAGKREIDPPEIGLSVKDRSQKSLRDHFKNAYEL